MRIIMNKVNYTNFFDSIAQVLEGYSYVVDYEIEGHQRFIK